MALKLRPAEERFIPYSTRAVSFKRMLGSTGDTSDHEARSDRSEAQDDRRDRNDKNPENQGRPRPSSLAITLATRQA